MLTESNTKTLAGAKIIIDTLKNLGVDTIFGYPGGIVLGLYDELYNRNDINHVLVRHEQSAVHAAEGYARVTGKCGVVLVTSGPGATNTVTGLLNAYLDGYPLIVLTGQVFCKQLGKDAFQEANICKIAESCSKKVYQISDANDIQSTLIEAFKVANSGKKGPVVIDLVKDIFTQNVAIRDFETVEKSENLFTDTTELEKLILNSHYPVILAGGGVNHSGAITELYEFAKNTDIPVVSTMMGLGTYPQDDNNYFGMVGIFGDKAANQILRQSDLIISLGARFNDRITCMFNGSDLYNKIVQIDINKDELSRNISPCYSLNADIKSVLAELNKNFGRFNKVFSDWKYYAGDLKKLNISRKKCSNLLHSFEVIREIENYTKDKSIIFTSEVGQHQLWAVQNLHFFRDRKILVSGGLGTMGFGLPAAIGACFADKTKPVVCITGDGSFQMSLHELATCKENNLNLKIIILNNGYLGMVRQLQEQNCDGRYSQTKISNPDFVTLAQSYGVKALRVSRFEDIQDALDEAFSTNETFIIDFVVEPMEVL